MEANAKKPDGLKSPAWAAKYLDTTTNTLANWRSTGRYALPYVKVGRSVRYRLSDLDAFIQSGMICPQPVGGVND